MSLANLLDIESNNKEIITVVGAGGKTSFIDSISKVYSDRLKVLVTTTTKIYKPYDGSYERMVLFDETDIEEIKDMEFNTGITICGKYINDDNKVVGLEFDEISILEDKFDLILIEGDGSKRKKLKGWNDNEPLVYPNTTKTIGILDITSFNMKINENNIHRLDKFIEQIGFKNHPYKKLNQKVEVPDLVKIVVGKDSLFKNSIGKKVLFINKVENSGREAVAKQLIYSVKEKDNSINTYYGSVKGDKSILYK